MTFIDSLEGKFDGEKGSGEGVTHLLHKEKRICRNRLIPCPKMESQIQIPKVPPEPSSYDYLGDT